MGLADLLYHVQIGYGSPEGQEFAAQVMEFIRYHAMKTSINLPRSVERSRRSKAASMTPKRTNGSRRLPSMCTN